MTNAANAAERSHQVLSEIMLPCNLFISASVIFFVQHCMFSAPKFTLAVARRVRVPAGSTAPVALFWLASGVEPHSSGAWRHCSGHHRDCKWEVDVHASATEAAPDIWAPPTGMCLCPKALACPRPTMKGTGCAVVVLLRIPPTH